MLLSGDLPRAGHLQPKAARVFAQGQSKAGPSLPGTILKTTFYTFLGYFYRLNSAGIFKQSMGG
jgi:hypothetical protein